MPIPWNDQAVVSAPIEGDLRRQLKAGTLSQVVLWLAQLKPIEWQNYLIAMPDRNVPPYRYTSNFIVELIAQRNLLLLLAAADQS